MIKCLMLNSNQTEGGGGGERGRDIRPTLLV